MGDGPCGEVPLALAAFVGDGHTTTALGVAEQAREDVAALRPHKMIVAADWLDDVCADQGPRWPAGLDRPWARRRVLEHLGGRLRWVETRSGLGEATARALDAAGVTHQVVTNGAGPKGPETRTGTVH